jgi:cytochrome c556
MMKPTLLIAAAFALGIVASTFAREAGADRTKALMRAKLEHSQALLGGLATEDFDQLAVHSHALTMLSQETDWNVIQTAEYRRLSEDFRRDTRSLTESAKAKNLDGATLAYVRLTIKCVECHKYVRSVQDGQLPSESRETSGLQGGVIQPADSDRE